MKHILSLCLIMWLCCPKADAKVELPEIIGDHMVLQQNSNAKLWGKARKNAQIEVTASWNILTFTTKAGEDGKWSITIPTPQAGYEPQEIVISDGEPTTLKNILIGDVWFCSGQSNMEMPLNGFWNNPIAGAQEAIANAYNYKGLRFATIARKGARTPQESCEGKWQVSTPETVQWCSATAFYFAQTLEQATHMPIGLIVCAWGGSTVEGWLPEEILNTYPDIDLKQVGSKECPEYLQPMIMYNGLLKPLQNYTIKGFIWYQGESNVGRAETYAERLATMVNLWRKEWNIGVLPFYYAEIAPFSEYGEGLSGALLREAQFKAQLLIANSGMISTNDLVEPYEADNVHPKNKTDVGKRLAYMALVNTYGVKGIADRGPVYKEMEINSGRAIISFEHAKDGYFYQKDIEGFEIASEDRVFHPAVAQTYDNLKIEVSSNAVKAPVAVRYAFKSYLPGTLKNTRGLPAYPFRTDSWEE